MEKWWDRFTPALSRGEWVVSPEGWAGVKVFFGVIKVGSFCAASGHSIL